MMEKMRNRKKKKGFTLIELVVVIAILGILAAIAVPRMIGFQDRARAQADQQVAAQVRNATALLWANREIVVTEPVTFTISNEGVISPATAITGITSPATGADLQAMLTTGANSLVRDFTLQNTGRMIRVAVDQNGRVKAEIQNNNTAAPTDITAWLTTP